MASPNGLDATQAAMPDYQLPDWETPNSPRRKTLRHISKSYIQKAKGGSFISTASQKLDHIMPSDRKYFGCSRRILLAILVTLVLAIFAIAIGLRIGLSRRSGSEDLPLPSNSKSFTGDLTYYSPALGACGIISSDNDNICAVSHIIFDAASIGSDPNANPLCGLKIRATRFDEQVNAERSIDLKVVDRCTGCAAKDLDLSPGAYRKLANPDRGRVDVTWAWLSPTGMI